MRWSLPLALLSCALSLPAVPLFAQDTATLPSTQVVLPPAPDALTPDQRTELDAWLTDMRKWQRMDKRWHNTVAHDPFGRILNRVPRPGAPAWLDARCAALTPAFLATLAGPVGDACRMLAGVDDDPVADTIRASTAAARADAEKPVNNSFLTRVHLDGGWTTTSSGLRMYGIIGSHISLVDVGRLQLFGPPGVIVLSVPDGSGSHELRAGYTWGMSLRLMDVRLFSPSKNMTLFLTMTKVWLTGGTYDRLATNGYDIAGFSLAPRRRK
jgi:hypothetical protein